MKIFFIFLLITTITFAQNSVMVFQNNSDYMHKALYDLVTKNIFLYSDFKIIDTKENNNYSQVKSKIKELTLKNNSDISILYNIKNFRDGFLLDYIIYNNSNRWYENQYYFRETNMFNAVNKVLDDFYKMNNVNISRDNYIKEDEYISLIGYYSDIISNENIYNLFYSFHKDNIYFNMDYLEYLFANNEKANDLISNILKNINKKNHYYFYVLGIKYYNSYKINVIYDDIEKSILNYEEAIKLKPNSYLYNEKLAKAYLLKNDYDNALKYYENAIALNDNNTDLIKEVLNILNRDFNKNANKIIEYLNQIISIDNNDDEAIEELAKLYESIGDYENAYLYYNKLIDAINYHLYIINNEKPNASLYDKYTAKKNKTEAKIKSIENKMK
ncbi:tetratricopeptide repeat protein [Brachyspira pilosicoli]|uniref:Tetratricopeptide repeat protein n=1 Tax=Brachyspira pilosicoli TaxID=52584 RepID=A0A5C8EQ83_BRAPL|nr:tetratricopeptide repeat protein [Brachyspira pilosicoli]TXJ39966.1 tetratricopeptide repeat protein [Brachyspira pilosicoli]